MIPGYDEHYTPIQWLSTTALSSFARCPRLYFYKVGCRLCPAEGTHVAMNYGFAIHQAIPQLLTGDEKTRLERAIKAFGSGWAESRPRADDKRNDQSATKVLLNFLSTHEGGRSLYELVDIPKHPGLLETTDKQSPYEVPFALDIGLPIPLASRIDAIVRHRDTGRYWAWELKTGGQIDDRLLNGFTNNPQAVLYKIAAQEYLGEEVEGTLVEAVKVHKTQVGSALKPVYVNKLQCEDYIKWARWIGSQILQCETMREFPKSPSGCHPYSMFAMPGYSCDFERLCTMTRDWTDLVGLYGKSKYEPFIMPTLDGKPIEPPVFKVEVPQ